MAPVGPSRFFEGQPPGHAADAGGETTDLAGRRGRDAEAVSLRSVPPTAAEAKQQTGDAFA
jgi:hypothetical protein